MSAKDNAVFQTAVGFSKDRDKKYYPESVIFGYAKLILMNESSLRMLFDADQLSDLSRVRFIFESNKIDTGLIKTAMPLVLMKISYDSNSAALKKYTGWLDESKENLTSEQIVVEALKVSLVPVTKVFAQGSDTGTVEDYLAGMEGGASGKSDKKSDSGSKKGGSLAGASSGSSSDSPKEGSDREIVTGPPADTDDFDVLAQRYRDLNAALLEVVKGQEAAVSKFVRGCFQAEVKEPNPKQPKAFFFFFGPPGVGKSLLAETAIDVLKLPSKSFNMSEYASKQSYEELIGIGEMYNSGKESNEGKLVKFVRENPESVLLFDEIEKAGLETLRQFLQILSSAKINNPYTGKAVDFSKTIIIFTSNLGRDLYSDRSTKLSTLPERIIFDAIQSSKDSEGAPALPPELCSRIASGNLIVFDHLSVRCLAEELTTGSFNRTIKYFSDKFGIKVTYPSQMPLLFLFNRGEGLDARVATSQSGNFIARELHELASQLGRKKKNPIKTIEFCIDWKGADDEIKNLFENAEKTEVMVFGDKQTVAAFPCKSDKYVINAAGTPEEAEAVLKRDIAAVFINPLHGSHGTNKNTLSITDYDSDGIALFRKLAEEESELPVYILETGDEFSDNDRLAFAREGADGTVAFSASGEESFTREFEELMSEIYMEQQSIEFSRKGWVIDFGSRQDVDDKGNVKIVFYNLRKCMAVDTESRGSILSAQDRPHEKFDDVIGAQNAKEELKYYIEFLKNPKQFMLKGGKAPKGVLLYGPPGTGKTMLARAMAGESDVTFLQTSASEFKSKWSGQGEENIRNLFRRAKRYAPAIIFIDEIDAIGKKRTGENPITESMLNALLTEMDGFKTSRKKPIFVLAATNYGVDEGEGIAQLDEALIRRFDRRICVDLPNREERKQYIKLLLKKQHAENVEEHEIDNLAERTTGQSLAIIQNVVDLAFKNSFRAGHSLTGADLVNSLDEYMTGEKHQHSEEYYKSVAIHEVGHGYISYLAGDKPTYVTIESRGNYGGYMMHDTDEDKGNYTHDELLGRIRTSLAGRAAEIVFYGEDKAVNTGASSDLQHATSLAFHLLCTYGMEGSLAVLSREEIMKSTLASDYLTKVNAILNEQMKAAIMAIEDGRDRIQKIADALVEKSHLTGKEFADLMEG